jgi:hypothetical protein
MSQKRIPADRLLFAMISSLRTLVVMLEKRGILDADEFAETLQQIAAEHRATGDPNNLADAIHAISMHIIESKI